MYVAPKMERGDLLQGKIFQCGDADKDFKL